MRVLAVGQEGAAERSVFVHPWHPLPVLRCPRRHLSAAPGPRAEVRSADRRGGQERLVQEARPGVVVAGLGGLEAASLCSPGRPPEVWGAGHSRGCRAGSWERGGLNSALTGRGPGSSGLLGPGLGLPQPCASVPASADPGGSQFYMWGEVESPHWPLPQASRGTNPAGQPSPHPSQVAGEGGLLDMMKCQGLAGGCQGLAGEGARA